MKALAARLALRLADETAAATTKETMPLLPTFEEFMSKFHRVFQNSSAEYLQRSQLYAQRRTEAADHNAEPGRLWTAGAGALWDRTDLELRTLTGSAPAPTWAGSALAAAHDASAAGVARGSWSNATVDVRQDHSSSAKSWAALKAWDRVIHEQGNCGSCWAVGAATLLRCHNEIHGADPERSFSVQEFVSCVPNPNQCGGKGGCGGATMGLALAWAVEHGSTPASELPYDSGWMGTTMECPNKHLPPKPPAPKPCGLRGLSKGQALTAGDRQGGINRWGCAQAAPPEERTAVRSVAAVQVPTAHRTGAEFGLIGWTRLPENRYAPLLNAVLELGPVGVSVDASMWYLYESGIFNGCKQHAVTISHAVVLMGFGTEGGIGYWNLQNSWGKDWGEYGGRIRLLRNGEAGDEAYCGDNYSPEVGIGCKGGPSPVRVCGMCGILYSGVLPTFK